MTKILGIDPSLTATGVIVLKNKKVETARLIKTKPTGDNKIKELKRLVEISSSVISYCDNEVDLVVMEGIAFMARNTVALVQLSALNYMIRNGIYNKNVKFVIIAPTTLKKFITDKGNAQKDLVMMNVYKQYGLTFEDDNLCDAFVLAKIGEALLNKKTNLTERQKEVIELLRPQLYEN